METPDIQDHEEPDSSPKFKNLHWLIAIPLSLWSVFWLCCNDYNYVTLTWRLFTTLGWLSFLLFLSPCGYAWFLVFSSAAWAPIWLTMLPWVGSSEDLSRKKIFFIVLLVPFVFGMILQYVGPYFYPVSWGGEDGHRVYVRFIPFVGGKSFDTK